MCFRHMFATLTTSLYGRLFLCIRGALEISRSPRYSDGSWLIRSSRKLFTTSTVLFRIPVLNMEPSPTGVLGIAPVSVNLPKIRFGQIFCVQTHTLTQGPYDTTSPTYPNNWGPRHLIHETVHLFWSNHKCAVSKERKDAFFTLFKDLKYLTQVFKPKNLGILTIWTLLPLNTSHSALRNLVILIRSSRQISKFYSSYNIISSQSRTRSWSRTFAF